MRGDKHLWWTGGEADGADWDGLMAMVLKSALVMLAVAGAVVPRSAFAAEPFGAEPLDAACAPLVGTFLTMKLIDGKPAPEEEGRSLISLTSGGQAFLSDSAQGGDLEFAPFSDARGAWTCSSGDAGLSWRATMVDFTFRNEMHEEQFVVRVELTGALDQGADMTGEAKIHFYPLADDPFTGTPEKSLAYVFNGQKIAVSPAP
ncbi:MAG: hypothetical protein AAGF45_03990 [Pseudomonadota bacterium]